MHQYNIDSHSIFVDGLHRDVEKDELKTFFGQVGKVVDVQIVKKNARHGKKEQTLVT